MIGNTPHNDVLPPSHRSKPARQRMASPKVLAALLMLMASASLQAVHLSRDGTGQVLLYPLYAAAESGYQTLFSLHNTTDRTKAVRVAYLEGFNQRRVASLNLYLAPHDSWTAAVFVFHPEGAAHLVTRDQSCTVPDLVGQTATPPTLPMTSSGDRVLPFSNSSYLGVNSDPGPEDILRTRIGSIEVIEMGDLVDDTMGSASAAQIIDGSARNCDQLNAAWELTDDVATSGYWAVDSGVDMQAASGGLMGSVSLINLFESTQVSYQAVAIDAFSESVQHFGPEDVFPVINSADHDSDQDGLINSITRNPETGDSIHSNWSRGVDAVSALFMTESLSADFNLADDIDLVTESFFYFPTRRFYTDSSINPSAVPPFQDLFEGVEDPFRGCDAPELNVWDRDGVIPRSACPVGVTCSPEPYAFETRSCTAVSIQRYSSDDNPGRPVLPDSGLDDDLLMRISSGRIEWGTLGINSELVSAEGIVFRGLPVMGYTLTSISNEVSFSAGVIGNYMGLVPHSRRPQVELPTED